MPTPDFVLALRAHVGTAPLWLSGVSAVVVDADERVLLVRRADNGRWTVVSGILDPGEQPAVAAVREVREETAVEVEVVALTSVVAGDLVHYPNGDSARYLDVCFLCAPLGGEAHVADDESVDVRWFGLDDLPAGLTESSRERLRHACAHLRGEASQPWFVRP